MEATTDVRGSLCSYSGYYTDTLTLKQSSSGGAASILSQLIIRNGGVVFGARYSSNFMSAEFACVEREEDLHLIKGSKYIPTQKRVSVNGEYVSLWPLVAEKLSSGREVLFTGLGCDVAALHSYLAASSVDTSRLFTVDLICYGPALPQIHSQYISSLEAKYHSRIKSFSPRYKLKGWTPPYIRAEFENGRVFSAPLYETEYGQAFRLYSREVCYHCRFRGENHTADITVGDYWGLTSDMPGWNPEGVSVFIVRTDRGGELMSRIDPEEFRLRPADVDFILKHNRMYYECKPKPKDYTKFCADLKTVGLHKAMMNHVGHVRYYARLMKRVVKKCIPAPVKKFLKAIHSHIFHRQ